MKGFGFVTGEDGKDYFVHYTALKEGVTLHENDSVSFEPVQGDRGMKAEHVTLLQSGESSHGSDEEDTEEESSEEDYDEEESQE